MNELMNNEIRMNHVELCELINKLRTEEGGRKELDKSDLLKKIRKEVNTMEILGLSTEGNFSVSEYKDKSGKVNPTYSMNRDGILQIASSESVYVRAKIIEYINALENKLKEQDRRKDLLLAIYEGGQDAISASKELTQIEVEEATKPLIDKIEQDEPLVTFGERILKEGDNILVRELAKIACDEGYKIGEKKLYAKLRDWNYICKNSTEPTQYAIKRDYFIVETRTINTPYGTKQVFTSKCTPKGQVRIVEKLMKELKED